MLIKKDPETIAAYFEDSSNLKGGYAREVVFPENIQELSAFIRKASEQRIPVTISGGGTGTTGSRIPFGGVALSMERFNKDIDISCERKAAIVEAGALVEDLKNEADKKGLFYMCHPTERTAFVGGTVATNASGARSFKYGATRKYVKRLTMVLTTGEVYDLRRGERTLTKNDSSLILDGGRKIVIPLPSYEIPHIKNSAGYFAKDGMDAIDLFIGQEGTLSVIVEIEIGLVKKPPDILSCFAFFDSEEKSWGFAGEARTLSRNPELGARQGIDALSIEYFDSNALNLLRTKNANVPSAARAAIFFEQEAADKKDDKALEGWMRLIEKHGGSVDATWVALTDQDIEKFAEFRYVIPESINDMVRQNGFRKLSTDIAVPDHNFLEMMHFYVDTLTELEIAHVVFGHIGESHVHVNLLPKTEEDLKRSEAICLSFARKGMSLGGTVSAEHGIGKVRHRYLEEMYGAKGILEMARIKKALDPNCILGLDNIFAKELLNRV